MGIQVYAVTLLATIGLQVVFLIAIIALFGLAIKFFRKFPFESFKRFYLHVLLGSISVLVLFYSLLFSIDIYTMHGKEFVLQDYRSFTINSVKEDIEGYGLDFLIVDSVFTDSVPPGTIFHQQPLSGTYVKEGRMIYFTMNRSTKQLFKIPDVYNKSAREAANQLRSSNFNVELEDDHAAYNPISSVVTQLKVGNIEVFPGQEFVGGTLITVLFGNGRGVNAILVPNLIGMSVGDAQQVLQDNDLRVGEVIGEGIINDTISAFVFDQRPLFETRLQSGDMVDIMIQQSLDTSDNP